MEFPHTTGRSRVPPRVRFRPRAIALTIATVVAVWGCGGGGSTPTPASNVTLTLTPNSVTVFRDATQTFTAKVTGTDNTAVTWSMEEPSGGTIDSAGLYTPPQNGAGTFHVVAVSQAYAGAIGIAVVIVPAPQITITPAAATLRPAGTQTFAATVTGLSNTAVNLTIQGSGGGLINSAGLYTAPSADGVYSVVATSVDESTLTASASVTVTTSSNLFAPTGTMNEARGLHTATLLPNNKVLVAYGSNSSSYTEGTGYVGLSSVEVYDPSTQAFTEIMGEDGSGIFGHTATLLPNGDVLLAGGFANDIWAYGDSTSNNGAGLYDSTTGVLGGTGNMTANRGWHTATMLKTGKVLIAGGSGGDITGEGLATAELYDPTAGTFTATGSMSVGRYMHTATLLQSGKVLIAGGALTSTSGPVATAEIYDPTTGTFTTTGVMTAARQGHTATLLADGRVLITGGDTSTGPGDLQATATTEIYDPSSGSFTATALMAAARDYHTATLLTNGTVLVAGGGNENSTAEIYDPVAGTFSITGGMEVGRSGHTATLLSNGNVLLAGGGIFNGLASAELYQ